jgi:hypothetical protein
MGIIRLTEREQLIERILRMPDEQIVELAELIESMVNDPNWGDEGISTDELERRNRLDRDAINATRGEPTKPLEDVLRDLDIE